MAIQVINDPYRHGGGGVAGEQFGQTLSTGLSNLANLKTQQLATRHGLQALGIHGDQAKQISVLPPQLQERVLNTLQQQRESQSLMQALGLGGEQQEMQDMGGPSEQLGTGEIRQGQPRQRQGVLNPQHALQIANIRREQENIGRKERFDLEKAERPFFKETTDQYKTSHKSLADLNRLEKLINQGKIVNPTEDHFQRYLSSVLKINLKDLRGADTEEFEKLVNGFVANAKSWFPGRVTDQDLRTFMTTLPGLSMSHEGKLRLIGSMRAAAEAQKIRYDTMRELMRANGGHLPPYAQAEVEDLIQPQLDALAEQFIKGETATPLSEAAKKGEKRNAWLRAAKAGLTAAGKVKDLVGGTVNTVGNAVGEAALGALLH